jgi:hypothetical protein
MPTILKGYDYSTVNQARELYRQFLDEYNTWRASRQPLSLTELRAKKAAIDARIEQTNPKLKGVREMNPYAEMLQRVEERIGEAGGVSAGEAYTPVVPSQIKITPGPISASVSGLPYGSAVVDIHNPAQTIEEMSPERFAIPITESKKDKFKSRLQAIAPMALMTGGLIGAASMAGTLGGAGAAGTAGLGGSTFAAPASVQAALGASAPMSLGGGLGAIGAGATGTKLASLGGSTFAAPASVQSALGASAPMSLGGGGMAGATGFSWSKFLPMAGTQIASSAFQGIMASKAAKTGAEAARYAGDIQLQAAQISAETQRQATKEALDYLREAEARGREDIAPWREAGVRALERLTGMVETGPGEFTESPGYQFRLSQGIKALERGAAARGSQLSGAQLKRLQEYGQGIASQEYDSFLRRYYESLQPLQSLAGLGQSTSALTAGLGAETGRSLADVGLTGAGRVGAYNVAGAQGLAGAANLAAQARGSGYINLANVGTGLTKNLAMLGYLTNPEYYGWS